MYANIVSWKICGLSIMDAENLQLDKTVFVLEVQIIWYIIG